MPFAGSAQKGTATLTIDRHAFGCTHGVLSNHPLMFVFSTFYMGTKNSMVFYLFFCGEAKESKVQYFYFGSCLFLLSVFNDCFPLFALKQKVEQRLQGWREAPPPSLANAQQPVVTL